MQIDLFSLFTVSREEMLREGGAYIETLNADRDGVVYIKLDLIEMAAQSLINQEGDMQ